MDFLDFLDDYFADHVRASALIRQRRPFALGLLSALAAGVSLFAALGGGLFLRPASWPALAFFLLLQIACVFLLTAVLHQLLDMTGARGDAGALFVQLGLSELAWLAAAPSALVLRALFPNAKWPMVLALTAIGAFSLALKARGLRDEYHIGGGRAWLTLGAPYLLLAALLALLATLAIAALVVKAFTA